MHPRQIHQVEDGSRDCGSFFLDAVGRYAPGQLHLLWSPARRPASVEIDRLIQQAWNTETHKAKANQTKLYDGRLCRLIDWSADRKHLNLTVGEVTFKEFLGTNLRHAYLRYTHGPEALANAIGVSSCISTADEFIVLGRRGPHNLHNASLLHPVGGMVELPRNQQADGNLPDFFAAAVAEIEEELGIARERTGEPVCMGLVRDKKIVQPELVFDVKTDLEAQEVRKLAATARDSHEHTELTLVRDNPSAVVTFIEQKLAELTPVALATVLLHGLLQWGSGWFTATRGYLRNVV
jgi:hypothetical protein